MNMISPCQPIRNKGKRQKHDIHSRRNMDVHRNINNRVGNGDDKHNN